MSSFTFVHEFNVANVEFNLLNCKLPVDAIIILAFSITKIE